MGIAPTSAIRGTTVAIVAAGASASAAPRALNGLQKAAHDIGATGDEAIRAIRSGGRAGLLDSAVGADLPAIFDVDVLRGIWSGNFGRQPLTAMVLPRGVDLNVKVGIVEGRNIVTSADASVSGIIRTPSGAEAGEFVRNITWKRGEAPVVNHSFLALEDAEQGGGFSRAFNDRAFSRYRDLGVERVKIHAALDVGGYAWARQGFELQTTASNNTQTAWSRAQKVRDLVSNAVDKRLITLKEANELADRVIDYDGHIPANAITSVRALSEHPLGRKVLLGNHWYGEKRLM